MSTNCIQCGTGVRNGPDLLCEECRGTEFVPVKQVIRALGDVYDWFQSDEEHPKPILDVLREVADELRADGQHIPKLEAVIKGLLTLCCRQHMDSNERASAACRIAGKAGVTLGPLREVPK